MNRFKFRGWNQKSKCWGAFFLSTGFCSNGFVSLVTSDVLFQQFTGIRDKNGKEIYEGDILKVEGQLIGSYFNLGNEELPAYPDNKTYTWIAKVIWDDGYACYLLEYIDHPDYSGRGKFKDEMIGVAPWAEVIGNIFENPELLK